jgi:hypothetical protein
MNKFVYNLEYLSTDVLELLILKIPFVEKNQFKQWIFLEDAPQDVYVLKKVFIIPTAKEMY